MTRIVLPNTGDLTAFGRDRGSGITRPTTDLRRGDTYFHTGLNCLLVYSDVGWRQAHVADVSAAGARTALSTANAADLYPGFQVRQTDTGVSYAWTGTGWQRVSGDRTLGDGFLANLTPSGIAGAPGWTDLATVTATASGAPVVVRWQATLWNGASGADRTANLQLVCDSTVIHSWANLSLLLANLPRTTKVAANTHTPTAGAHTWKVQANGSVGAAVIGESASLSVVETG